GGGGVTTDLLRGAGHRPRGVDVDRALAGVGDVLDTRDAEILWRQLATAGFRGGILRARDAQDRPLRYECRHAEGGGADHECASVDLAIAKSVDQRLIPCVEHDVTTSSARSPSDPRIRQGSSLDSRITTCERSSVSAPSPPCGVHRQLFCIALIFE